MRRFTLVTLLSAAAVFGANTAGMKSGKAELKWAGSLAFGPDAILFVGDSIGGAIYAIDTQDRTPGHAAKIDIKGINEKIAAVLGTSADQILINDLAVNPISKKAYLSVSRGRGPDGIPVILRVDAKGNISELAMDNVKYSSVSLSDAPAADLSDTRARGRRLEAITDIAYVNGSVVVAGLSNEEFSSSLRSIPYPFQEGVKGAGIEIYHGSHGRFETNAPVRTFVAYQIQKQPYILAAYTCTPLVKIPVSDLKPGNKIKGTTIAELGNHNRPLDMIVYHKDGHDYILMSNSSRGVMKMSAEGLDSYKPITAQTEITGVPYKTIDDLKGVEQLDKYDESNALILQADNGSVNLRSVPLP
jgi:hypothetical protein